jgi:hypothetical protein
LRNVASKLKELAAQHEDQNGKYQTFKTSHKEKQNLRHCSPRVGEEGDLLDQTDAESWGKMACHICIDPHHQ